MMMMVMMVMTVAIEMNTDWQNKARKNSGSNAWANIRALESDAI